MLGHELWMPLDFLLPHPEKNEAGERGNIEDYIQNLHATIQQVFDRVCENLAKATTHQKRDYDTKATGRSFQMGQGVWLYNPIKKKGRSTKLDYPWIGPYTIVR